MILIIIKRKEAEQEMNGNGNGNGEQQGSETAEETGLHVRIAEMDSSQRGMETKEKESTITQYNISP